MKRKILALVLCGALSLGTCVPAFAAESLPETEAPVQTSEYEPVDSTLEAATQTDADSAMTEENGNSTEELQEQSETVEVSLNATDVTIYGMDSDCPITIPSSYSQKFQLTVKGAKSVSYEVTMGTTATVSSTGLVKVKYETWYYYDEYSTSIKEEGKVPNQIKQLMFGGDSEITVTADGKRYKVNVHVIDYKETYAEKVIQEYIKNNFHSGMTDMETLKKIAAFPAQYEYGGYSDYVDMIVYGKGSCVASTGAIYTICCKLGITAWARNGNKDYNAGSGHYNAMAYYHGKYYELEAGYVEAAPRSYDVWERDSLFSYRYTDEGASVYQYDGNDNTKKEFDFPESINGHKLVEIEANYSYESTPSKVEKIRIPGTVKRIGDKAFAYFDKLTLIYVPKSVIDIGKDVFLRSPNVKIYGEAGSYAEIYAKKNNLTFVRYTPLTTKPADVKNLKAIPNGGSRTYIGWTKSANATGYLIYARKNGTYGYCGMTKSTSFTDKNAMSDSYNFYWVYPYTEDPVTGKKMIGSCAKYVYAKGICPSVGNLKAVSQTGGVRLTWSKSSGAVGYLVYGRTGTGDYHYIGMTGSLAYADKKASRTQYNFYWVIPYHKNSAGKLVAGYKGTYVYGKAK